MLLRCIWLTGLTIWAADAADAEYVKDILYYSLGARAQIHRQAGMSRSAEGPKPKDALCR